ncbi:hypothetical protein PLESTF_000260100 [Pleodorina starrii]|nr:hypothetical protein PLESTF_000260100 [Pleodorina starrii]
MQMTKTTFLVTGFSTFHGVDANPTERLAAWLKVNLEQGNPMLGQDFEVHDVSILNVAATDVDAYFAQLAHQLEQGAVQGISSGAAPAGAEGEVLIGHFAAAAVAPPPLQPPSQRVVLLHLGVATTATEYRLESRAANCANFRVPDERGWSPAMEEIEPGRGTDSWVGSGLPLAAVCERLAARGHNVMVSEDAGQFVCNWTYYRACRLAERYAGMQAVFVHVPPLEVEDEAKQRAFLLDAMREIARLRACPFSAATDVPPKEALSSV